MMPRISAMPNLRDVGGRPTADGRRVRTGVVFRSDQIDQLTDDDRRALAALELRAVFDLRTDAERELRPGQRIPGANHVVLDVMADDRKSAPAQLVRLLTQPGDADALLGNGKGAAMFLDSYREFVRLPSARTAFGRLYAGLADPGRLPALLHCTTGKDRTGWACAALQTLLGVSSEHVLEDFLASNDFVLPKYRPYLDAFAAHGGDPELLVPVLSVRPEYLAASFDEVRRGFGSIEGYFSYGLGLGAASIESLRNQLLVNVQDSTR
ncbi:MAG: tyrosine-protein phosphatase [Gammaproteobacteria bacterium]|nr:tyrosine-protein phosphatase [Gammaproteobacteria bacterium]